MNKRFKEIMNKVAQGAPMDPMMGMPMGGDQMAGGMGGAMGGGAPVPPPAPTPEEALMMAGGMGPAMIPGAIPEMEGGVDKDQVIADQSSAISSLADTVESLTNMHSSIGNDSDAAAENIAATLAGAGMLNGLQEEDLPPIEGEMPAI